jgi:hypothetical protein
LIGFAEVIAMLAWVIGITSVIFLFGIGFLLYRPRRSRYVDSTGWQREHWEEEHEREKILLHREL